MNSKNVDTKKSYELSSYKSFNEFYPFYLSQHTSKLNRKLHFIGTLLSLFVLLYSLLTNQYSFLIFSPVCGYAFAWIGHFFIEKNKPATFKNPFYSLMGDFVMAYDTLTLNISNRYKEYGLEETT